MEDQQKNETGASKIKKALLSLLGIAIGVLFSLPYFLFREEIGRIPALGYLGVLASCAISNGSLFLPTSSTLIVLSASTALNPFLCILTGGLGAAIGEQVSYLCGRIGLSWIERDPEKENRIVRWLDRNSMLTVFLFAYLPLPLFDLVGVTAGAVKMNWLKFTGAAATGKLLKFTTVVVYMRYMLPHFIGQLPEWVQTLYGSYI